MKAIVDLIGSHTSTGASSLVHRLGGDSRAGGLGLGIASPTRIIQVSGIAGGSIIKIEGSLDGTNWVTWIANINADNAFIVDDGPVMMRSNCTTYGSGTVEVHFQKFVEE